MAPSQPIQFLLDSGAAVLVVNFSVVRQQSITEAMTCTVGANGTPFFGQGTVILQLGNFKVDHQFIVGVISPLNAYWEQIFYNSTVLF